MACPRDARGKRRIGHLTIGRRSAPDLFHTRAASPVGGSPSRYREGMPPTLRICALDRSVEMRSTGPGTQPLLDAATRLVGLPGRRAGFVPRRATGDRPALRRHQPRTDGRPATAHPTGDSAADRGADRQAAAARGCGEPSGHWRQPGLRGSRGDGEDHPDPRAGRRYGYLTDETVGIDSTGRVHPYPRPLSRRLPEGGPKHEASPDDLGLARAHPNPTVKRVIVLSRPRGHADSPDIEQLGTLDAVHHILPETSSPGRLPGPLRTLAALTEQCRPVLRCSYGEADDLVALTADLIGEVS